MNAVSKKLTAVLLMVSLTALCACKKSQEAPANDAKAPASQQTAEAQFSEQQLDELFAPIALYPDPLLAQVIPAATFVDQVDEAERLLGGKADNDLIDRQDWDVSVKAIAHYPVILKRMSENPDWTVALGQAYVNQPKDVKKSIQRLRDEAWEAGSLVTTPQQEVISQGENIAIVPAEPQVIYVPEYDPEDVYVEQDSSVSTETAAAPADSGVSTGAAVATAAIAFGAGLALGAWLNRDSNWDDDDFIYYHGWSGGGWVGANRGYVGVNQSIYVNNSYRNVNVNRSVTNRNINSYRGDLDRRATVRHDRNIDSKQRNAGDLHKGGLNDRSPDRAGERRGGDRDVRERQPNAREDRTRASATGSGRAFGGSGQATAGAERNRGSNRQTASSGRTGGASAGTPQRSGGSGSSARSGGGGGGSTRSGGGGGGSARSGGGGGGRR